MYEYINIYVSIYLSLYIYIYIYICIYIYIYYVQVIVQVLWKMSRDAAEEVVGKIGGPKSPNQSTRSDELLDRDTARTIQHAIRRPRRFPGSTAITITGPEVKSCWIGTQPERCSMRFVSY